MTTQELKNSIEKVLGNSIRCLLPSYWWKKLFHSVADRIDEVEQKIDGIEIPDGVPIVNSESELDKLKLPKGSVASVVTEGYGFSQCYIPTEEDLRGDFNVFFSKLTRVKSVARTVNHLQKDEEAYLILLGANYLNDNTYMLIGAINDSVASIYTYSGNINGELVHGFLSNDARLSDLNKILAEGDLRLGFVGNSIEEDNIEQQLAILDKVFAINGTSDVYNKSGVWEKLAKASDAGSDEAVFVVVFDQQRNVILSDEEKEANKIAYRKYVVDPEIKCKLKYYLIDDEGKYLPGQPLANLVGDSFWTSDMLTSSIVFQDVNFGNTPAEYELFGKYDVHFIDDGSVEVYQHWNFGEISLIHMGGDSVLEWQKKPNKDLYDVWMNNYSRPGPALVRWAVNGGIATYPAQVLKMKISGNYEIHFFIWDYATMSEYKLNADGTVEKLRIESLIESEMSDDSYNGVQNRVVKKYIDDAVSSLTQEVIDNEEVTAAALVDLYGRITKNRQEVNKAIAELNVPSLATKEELMEAEEVAATAINDLNTRIQEIVTRLNNAGI